MEATSDQGEVGASSVRRREKSHDRSLTGASGGPLFGALDLGTNNCRLLIARFEQERIQVVDAFSRIVRLGEGLGATGRLSDDAIERTIAALRICTNKLRWHDVSNQRLIATEACRSAVNGSDFIARVKQDLGIELEIIDRETEARLAAAGAGPLMDPNADTVLVFDIGGGSTEVMWMKRHGDEFELATWDSLQVGVVTLSESVGGGKHVAPEHFEQMCRIVRDKLLPFADEVRLTHGATARPSHLLGTSGTVTTIAGVHLGLRQYDRTAVDGCWLTTEDVDSVMQRILAMSYDHRVSNGCIGRERADLVIAGCAIFEEIRRAFPSPRVRVADRGLREGLLTQMSRIQKVNCP